MTPSTGNLAAPSIEQTLLEYQAILENASVGILFTRDRKVLHCNPRFSEIYGWPHGELVGQSGSVFYLSEDDYNDIGRLAGPKLARGELLDTERPMRRKDGSTVYCHMRAKAINPRDTAAGTIWIVEDITAQKQAQLALDEARRELERRVEERTVELARINEQLQSEINERKAMEKHLRAEEARFRDLTELSSDWFWEQDEEFRFVEVKGVVNPALRTSSHVVGKRRWELPILGVSDAQWQRHREQLHGHLPFKNFHYQIEIPGQPGNIRWFSVSGRPIFEDGEFKGYRGTGTDITRSKKSEQQIAYLAYHDALTGMPNRLLLQDRLQQAIAAAERGKTRLALVYADLDNFKKINDSLGHAAGDALLKVVAQRIKDCVRDTDTVSRQGGDEFLIVLGDLQSAEAALPVLSKLVARLQEPFSWEGQEFITSASLGVAVYPDDGLNFETLQKKADMAMYRAKSAGRNTYRFFDNEMDDEAVEHLLIRNGIRLALERGEFQLYYQPQIDLRSGKIIGAEALLRWNHPTYGLVTPGRFITIAEDSGQIVPIGDWVLHEACRQARAWQQAGMPPLLMAVNLSPVQFRRGHVEQAVLAALSASGLAPKLLELELTESILIQDIEQVQACVKRLNALGVQLSIDDFGTGYSSLSYLKRFSIDKLKIDQSFVRDLTSAADDVAIVRAIIEMAHSLGLRVLAEGVETPEILCRLVEFGCDEAQGFHFARPMPAEEFARYLAAAPASVG